MLVITATTLPSAPRCTIAVRGTVTVTLCEIAPDCGASDCGASVEIGDEPAEPNPQRGN